MNEILESDETHLKNDEKIVLEKHFFSKKDSRSHKVGRIEIFEGNHS